jgi:hypothetical protein
MKKILALAISTAFLFALVFAQNGFAGSEKGKDVKKTEVKKTDKKGPIPETLLGIWTSEKKDIILTLQADKVIFNDKRSGIENIYEGPFFKSIATNNLLAFKITKSDSGGYDTTETFKAFFISFQYSIEKDGTLSVNFMGQTRGLTPEADIATEAAPKDKWWSSVKFSKSK